MIIENQMIEDEPRRGEMIIEKTNDWRWTPKGWNDYRKTN